MEDMEDSDINKITGSRTGTFSRPELEALFSFATCTPAQIAAAILEETKQFP
jgi:hypothetical protein